MIELVSLVIGSLAFTIAMYPIAQALWGRPHLKIKFAVETVTDQEVLRCLIFNRPIRARVGRILRIERQTAEDLWAGFEIRESGTNKVIVPTVAADISVPEREVGMRVRLPSSIIPAHINVGVHKDERVEVIGVGAYGAVLDPGQYTLDVGLRLSGKALKAERTFIVRTNGIHVDTH